MSVEAPERWLTLREAAAALDDEHGIKTTWRSLEKLVGQGAPSAKNFGKRQVRLSELLEWLREEGIIER